MGRRGLMMPEAQGKDKRRWGKPWHVSRWPDATPAQKKTLSVLDWYVLRREWAQGLLLLLGVKVFFPGVLAIFSVSLLFSTRTVMPAGFPLRTILASVQGVGVDASELAKMAGNGEALAAVVYQDLADVSWDKRASTLELSLLWTEETQMVLGGMRTGYSEETLEILVVEPAGLDVSDQVRGALARQFVRDIIELDPNWRDTSVPGALPEGVALSLSQAIAPNWEELRKIASDPAGLTYRAWSDTWVRVRGRMSFLYVSVYAMAIVAPALFVFALVKGVRVHRHLKRLQSGCEKCGYPVLFAGEPDKEGMLKPCSECGHDMNEVLARYRKKKEKWEGLVLRARRIVGVR